MYKNIDFIKDDITVLQLDYKLLIEQIKNEKFKYIFIDPPYPIAQEAINYLLSTIDKYNMLESNGYIVGEIPNGYNLKDNYQNFKLRKTIKFSPLTTIWQYEKK